MSKRILTAIHEPYVGLDNQKRFTSEKGIVSEDDIVIPKAAGKGIMLDLDTPTFGWRDFWA